MKRQGDLLFMKSALNDFPSPFVQKDGVIEKGEISGHAHRLEGGQVVTAQGVTYCQVPNGGRVVHEEHDAIELEPGIWEVRRQREYVGPNEEQTVYD
jgi:hypothetical protein